MEESSSSGDFRDRGKISWFPHCCFFSVFFFFFAMFRFWGGRFIMDYGRDLEMEL